MQGWWRGQGWLARRASKLPRVLCQVRVGRAGQGRVLPSPEGAQRQTPGSSCRCGAVGRAPGTGERQRPEQGDGEALGLWSGGGGGGGVSPQGFLPSQEIFGPVLTVYVYPDDKYKETLRLVDSTSSYGLTGAVFAQDK